MIWKVSWWSAKYPDDLKTYTLLSQSWQCHNLRALCGRFLRGKACCPKSFVFFYSEQVPVSDVSFPLPSKWVRWSGVKGVLVQGLFSWVPWSIVQRLCGQRFPFLASLGPRSRISHFWVRDSACHNLVVRLRFFRGLHTLLVLYHCGPIIIGSNADTLITASF